MNKRFRVCDLEQPFLLPPSLQDWLPENHLARFVAEVSKELDLSAIYAEYEHGDGRGLSAYLPLLLTRLLLYGYSVGMTSSRAMERVTYDHVAFRYLAADQPTGSPSVPEPPPSNWAEFQITKRRTISGRSAARPARTASICARKRSSSWRSVSVGDSPVNSLNSCTICI